MPEKNLKPYFVTVKETLRRTVIVLAEDIDHAYDIAYDLTNEDVITTDAFDHFERELFTREATEDAVEGHRFAVYGKEGRLQ